MRIHTVAGPVPSSSSKLAAHKLSVVRSPDKLVMGVPLALVHMALGSDRGSKRLQGRLKRKIDYNPCVRLHQTGQSQGIRSAHEQRAEVHRTQTQMPCRARQALCYHANSCSRTSEKSQTHTYRVDTLFHSLGDRAALLARAFCL